MTSLKPLLHVNKPFIFKVNQFRLGELSSLVIQLRDEPFQQHVLLLEILVHWQVVM